MSSEDMFALFAANANSMQEFARETGHVVVRATEAAPEAVATPSEPRRAALDDAPKLPWWQRVGLAPPPKKVRRRRLARPAVEMPIQPTGT